MKGNSISELIKHQVVNPTDTKLKEPPKLIKFVESIGDNDRLYTNTDLTLREISSTVTIEPKGITKIDTPQKLVDEPFDKKTHEITKDKGSEVVNKTQNSSQGIQTSFLKRYSTLKVTD